MDEKLRDTRRIFELDEKLRDTKRIFELLDRRNPLPSSSPGLGRGTTTVVGEIRVRIVPPGLKVSRLR